MRLEIRIWDLEPLDKEYFKREVGLVQLDIQRQVVDEIKKRQHDRNYGQKLLQAVERTVLRTPVSSLRAMIETLEQVSQHQFMQYDIIQEYDTGWRMGVTLDESYFKTAKALKSMPMGVGSQLQKHITATKDGFIKDWKKMCKEYTKKNYDVIVLAYE